MGPPEKTLETHQYAQNKTHFTHGRIIQFRASRCLKFLHFVLGIIVREQIRATTMMMEMISITWTMSSCRGM
ncbi:hypothetical protein I3843_15G082700 [Carya illinoinensis]|uniref:Uncharacterized protein n=1 Tax=Carya illinoinensis TaxID=32201 RepID=A0A8T1NBQ8_CARIL|nr:hypothetical protein CIPAW_15G091400 [Carya illinoinensis]KAG7944117.1 hypothetical protein I3843_15G082700 [Carya illinoinensis]